MCGLYCTARARRPIGTRNTTLVPPSGASCISSVPSSSADTRVRTICRPSRSDFSTLKPSGSPRPLSWTTTSSQRADRSARIVTEPPGAAASLSGLASAGLAARFGRRRVLAASGILMTLTGLDLALANQSVLLVLAGITGMLGAASLDLGPFAAVEQAVLAEVVAPGARNVAFARYSLLGGIFNAAGGLAATLATGPAQTSSFFLLYAGIGLATAGLPLLMSASVEGPAGARAFGPAPRQGRCSTGNIHP